MFTYMVFNLSKYIYVYIDIYQMVLNRSIKILFDDVHDMYDRVSTLEMDRRLYWSLVLFAFCPVVTLLRYL